LLSLSNYF